MALKKDFYIEIFEKEQKWIELINANLLNSIYCKFSLQPFYLEKKEELEQEYNLTHNEIIGNIIEIINQLITQIELFNEQFKIGKEIDISLLLPLFLTTQMNNTSKKEEKNNEINKLQNTERLLGNQLVNIENNISLYDDDYVYDDFPEEIKKVK